MNNNESDNSLLFFCLFLSTTRLLIIRIKNSGLLLVYQIIGHLTRILPNLDRITPILFCLIFIIIL